MWRGCKPKAATYCCHINKVSSSVISIDIKTCNMQQKNLQFLRDHLSLTFWFVTQVTPPLPPAVVKAKVTLARPATPTQSRRNPRLRKVRDKRKLSCEIIPQQETTVFIENISQYFIYL